MKKIAISSAVSKLLDENRDQRFPSKEHEQAMEEFLKDVMETYTENKVYVKNIILKRLMIANDVHKFKVEWIDAKGEIRLNTGYRIQYNNSLGPYKGGLRFHPTVNQGVLKFLAFEQIIKNALTGLRIGGAKGGADFDPKGKTDIEIMSFCKAFMLKLHKYIGPNRDIPAGDIGVGGREINYLYGAYLKIRDSHEGVLTGKSILFGGSETRTQATGYGLIYFTEEILKHKLVFGENGLKGKTCTVSGSGNVAIYAIEKLFDLGAIPVTCSDSKGSIYDSKGIDLELLKKIKLENRGSLEKYIEEREHAQYVPVSEYEKDSHHVWSVPCDAAFPCATQNELTKNDAKNLLKNGCKIVAEGANMPSTAKAIDIFLKNQILFAPAKAANAGGVAVSELEMSQNASKDYDTFDKVDARLKVIMVNIFKILEKVNVDKKLGNNFRKAANIAGFEIVARAMIEQGV